ncbi:hypothetical protein [Mycoplasma nasistruthionis]|uniref:Uncharacterized protein n=1 Tax=Mycoplasma nasistruthionis TaxID=353852 RepID=A0A5B7XVF2_9MOLU|nr:hypothetical protein [Mycoplasma nasistruthionis]QCZ36667.1 hypothetical protein FG904_01385 [Mycoplasma nasistruthionis]
MSLNYIKKKCNNNTELVFHTLRGEDHEVLLKLYLKSNIRNKELKSFIKNAKFRKQITLCIKNFKDLDAMKHYKLNVLTKFKDNYLIFLPYQDLNLLALWYCRYLPLKTQQKIQDIYYELKPIKKLIQILLNKFQLITKINFPQLFQLQDCFKNKLQHYFNCSQYNDYLCYTHDFEHCNLVWQHILDQNATHLSSNLEKVNKENILSSNTYYILPLFYKSSDFKTNIENFYLDFSKNSTSTKIHLLLFNSNHQIVSVYDYANTEWIWAINNYFTTKKINKPKLIIYAKNPIFSMLFDILNKQDMYQIDYFDFNWNNNLYKYPSLKINNYVNFYRNINSLNGQDNHCVCLSKILNTKQCIKFIYSHKLWTKKHKEMEYLTSIFPIINSKYNQNNKENIYNYANLYDNRIFNWLKETTFIFKANYQATVVEHVYPELDALLNLEENIELIESLINSTNISKNFNLNLVFQPQIDINFFFKFFQMTLNLLNEKLIELEINYSFKMSDLFDFFMIYFKYANVKTLHLYPNLIKELKFCKQLNNYDKINRLLLIIFNKI